jgi:hypothetical protein
LSHGPLTLDERESRVPKLAKELADFGAELRLAYKYTAADPASSLTKSRMVMEKLLLEVYAQEMGRAPRKPLLGEMLADNQFTKKIERRIVSRMNSVREMGNLGPSGVAVDPSDAVRVLDGLCTILDWYRQRPEYLSSTRGRSDQGEGSGNRELLFRAAGLPMAEEQAEQKTVNSLAEGTALTNPISPLSHGPLTLDERESRILKLAKQFADFGAELRLAYAYSNVDPASSLAKSRSTRPL